MPSRSATPGRNTSITASALLREAQERRPTPSGALRSRPIARLPRCIAFVAGRAWSVARGDVGAFDAQHLGAEVGEQHPAERARPEPGDLEDARIP